MNVEIVAGPALEDAEGELLIVPVFAERSWGPGAEWAAERLGGWLEAYLDDVEFTGAAGESVKVPGAGNLPFRDVVFVGLGEEIDAEGLRRAAGTAARGAASAATVVTTLHQVEIDDAVALVTEGFGLGAYRFDKYKSEPKPFKTERVLLAGAGDVSASVESAAAIVDAVAFARDLVNEPPVAKPPAAFAERAVEAASAAGVTVEVWDMDRIREERLGGVIAVNSGSDQPARVVLLRWQPEGATASVALVGKGIVFDSGGLSIKPAKSMETMKTDMSGAAAVIAATVAIARRRLPVNVLTIAPLTENLTGGKAQRPGDVMRARNGKTIEVLNTDAEGRLILADGLSLAAEESPDLIVDIATLTGACAVALGPGIGGLWTNDDEAGERVLGAAARSGERFWQMPLETEYRKHIDSTVADMKNTGERYGGAITAALLLKEFVGDHPWVHLDIAGPARAGKAEHYVSEGGTGFGVRTLVALAEDFAG